MTNVPWQLLGVVGGGRQVAIRYSIGVCDETDRVRLTEDAKAVTIEVIVRDRSTPGRPCVQSARVIDQLVTLTQPLGDRKLVDPVTATR